MKNNQFLSTFLDKSETLRVAAHERLGEVLRAMRQILEKYPKIQSTELLMSAGNLIQQVKSFNYEEKADPTLFIESVDQLTLAFSTRFEIFFSKYYCYIIFLYV